MRNFAASQLGQPQRLGLTNPPPVSRGSSSVGRARHSHCRGRGFDSPLLHHSVWPVRPFCTHPRLLPQSRGYFAVIGSGRINFRPSAGLSGREFSVSDCVRPGEVNPATVLAYAFAIRAVRIADIFSFIRNGCSFTLSRKFSITSKSLSENR